MGARLRGARLPIRKTIRYSSLPHRRRLHSSTIWRGKNNQSNDEADSERNIFSQEAIAEEEDIGKESLLQRQRDALSREPTWQGDERVQDTILRMLMDKHQPLRIKGQSAPGQHPADAKLQSIQKPNMMASPSAGRESNSAAIADVEKIIPEGVTEAGEDGRRLAKTPDNKPWRAVYVNPMLQVGKEGKDADPSIYYARYIGLPPSSPHRRSAKTASGKERLKLAGIKTETLPLDDRNKMRAIREGVRKWDRAGRMRGVKEEAMQYRRTREEERERGTMEEQPMSDEEGEAQIAMVGGRGFQSIANERIEAAMKTDYFRRNSLRGKPLEKDLHASNPYLKGEERIMNRLIQRQGAAPPWVELNVQLENEQSDFRKRLADSWLRRATRIILATSYMREGLEPIRIQSNETFDDLMQREMFNSGQKKLLNLVNGYTDSEWEQKEQAYHDVGIRDVNNLIRRYNVVAPVSARRGLLIREWELDRLRKESRVELARRLSDGLIPSSTSNAQNTHHSSSASKSSASSTSNLFGGWLSSPDASQTTHPSGYSGRSIQGGDDGTSAGGTSHEERHRHARRRSASGGYITAFVRRTAERARQFVNW
ncbi:uncharacterized protein FA14DRAFT_125284 [Meira miltonrushii]|uniref:DnaJ homologue subfamily C member 28 conserved domain-containing protein n=1 Tax=Meira miltonrushii TaxID=1280837 RepID=A0A316V8J1_9BASI|nr:uncharacterized protein FA14DRAFT_125284 [Meira miltonrushii]PWN33816.1 hypothetical protein FA14DRAFT_125284 [Meira miltonrushii]